MHKLLDQIVQMTGYRPRLLVVDDDPVTVAILRMIFERKIDIVSAATGTAAMAQCHSARPDLILLDINLGEEDGFDLCQHIKRQPDLAGIPVIFITGSHAEEDEVQAFKLGAVDFIRKPISPFIAESRVVTHLALQLQTALLKRVAHSDGLTGLKNRRTFDEELERDWKECARTGWPLSVIMIDIDYFKQYNDNYGHLAGDACLRRVASVIHAALCRPSDCAARYGGEEFTCLLPSTDFKGALSVAENIRSCISALAIAHRDGATAAQIVTASIGVASCYPSADAGWLDLLAAADHQLYRAKDSGRDRVCGMLRAPGNHGASLHATSRSTGQEAAGSQAAPPGAN
ncbi:GGDEF domain-containing response regulator [Massilia eburnea]|nr:diguanylate cyclase [Massilia eburnea]